jgi:predicted nucleotidyltransferase
MDRPQLNEIIAKIENALTDLRPQYHIDSLGVFGSYVRNDQTADSDLDVLVTFSQAPSLFTFIRLENTLSDLVGVQVDLVMEDGLKPGIADRVLEEVVRLP